MADEPAAVETIPAPEPAPAPSPEWRAALPEEIRGDKALADFKDVGGLAKSYLDTKRLVGDAVRLPKPDATPEEKAAFHRKLGVPDSPDKYGETLPVLPDGLAWDPGTIAGFHQVAHGAGLTPPQVQALVNWYGTHSIQTRDLLTAEEGREAQASHAKAITQIEREWGPKDSPAWKRHAALAERVVHQFFGGDQRMLEQLAMRPDDPVSPSAVLGLARIGLGTLEHGYLDGGAVPEVDKEHFARQITDTRAELAKVNPGSPRYAEIKASLDRLYQQRYSGGAR